ncbi:hypothetical protein ACF0H5_011611 [Mactra antiquata]
MKSSEVETKAEEPGPRETSKSNNKTGDFDVFILESNEIKKEEKNEYGNSNNGMFSPELYDQDITEICLDQYVDDKDNTSNAHDDDLTEMNAPIKIETEEINESKNTISKDKAKDCDTESLQVPGCNKINQVDTKKRVLSPNRDENDGTDCKRFKFDDTNIAKTTQSQSQNYGDMSETMSDNNLPIAVVAPLGFNEDLFMDPPSLKGKDDVTDMKQDITSLLDSFGDNDEKSLTLFDADFDKIKSDILSTQTFKTADGSNWTFDLQNSGFDNIFDKEPLKSDRNQNTKTVNDSNKKVEEIQPQKSFQRQPSVEHDILDFEKVLNNVLQKKSQNIKPCGNSVEPASTKMQYTLPRCSLTTNKCNPGPNQPCQHVANSDLLRELLDQKTESTSAQAKRRQEIDLSFLQPEVLAGKGLSVSSDKILQTRTIDPRLTSVPYIERSRNSVPFSPVSSTAVSKPSVSSMSITPSVEQTMHSVSSSTNTSMPSTDPISLAEQRRASVTLHHKVPPYGSSEKLVTSSSQMDDESGTSNIIKEAFDFATEVTDSFNNVHTNNRSPRFEDHFNGMDRRVTTPTGLMSANEQIPRSQNGFPPDSFRNDKGVSLFNRQMMGNVPMRNVNSSGLVMKTEDPLSLNFDQSRGPNKSMPHPNNFESLAQPARPQGFDNLANNIHPNGTNGSFQMDRDIRGLSNISSMAGKVGNQFPQDHLQSKGLSEEQSRYMPNSSVNNTNGSHAASFMQRGNHQQINMGSSMGYTSNTLDHSRHQMTQQGQPMRMAMPGNDLLQIAPDDPMQRHLSGNNSAGRSSIGMVGSDSTLQIGMQERIRAMNVQQWYRRRMQSQMNRFPQQQMMMQRPSVGPGGFPGREQLRHQTHPSAINNPRLSANIGMQPYNYPQGHSQVQNQYHNKMGQGQGQMPYQQFMDQRSQGMNDMHGQNQARISRAFNINNPAENTGSVVEQSLYPDSIPEFDLKHQSNNQQGSEMFPFNI